MFYLLLFLCGCLTGVSAVLFGFGEIGRAHV